MRNRRIGRKWKVDMNKRKRKKNNYEKSKITKQNNKTKTKSWDERKRKERRKRATKASWWTGARGEWKKLKKNRKRRTWGQRKGGIGDSSKRQSDLRSHLNPAGEALVKCSRAWGKYSVRVKNYSTTPAGMGLDPLFRGMRLWRLNEGGLLTLSWRPSGVQGD